ncbi:hypothetical protein SLEP1_g24407 [Rubroshorea leprosula]|uniref:Uncharacterized protein n=1 Tax=Rubroshorea leprosula TaxID=152421 RepID=A0AAV5JQ11_9ROSI|nr:hypothetical protein SLEP1_g24407 [Rubroshorea leprosula]
MNLASFKPCAFVGSSLTSVRRLFRSRFWGVTIIYLNRWSPYT